MHLLDTDGITSGIRKAFLIYLACSNRPIGELLFPNPKDIKKSYTEKFVGMTAERVKLNDLLATRERMVTELQRSLTKTDQRFLLSVVSAQPEWELVDVAHAKDLPAMKWKLHNVEQLRKRNPKKFREQLSHLEENLAKISTQDIP